MTEVDRRSTEHHTNPILPIPGRAIRYFFFFTFCLASLSVPQIVTVQWECTLLAVPSFFTLMLPVHLRWYRVASTTIVAPDTEI